jgi:hypothetical protein
LGQRLFQYYDEHDRAWGLYVDERYVEGPRGIEAHPGARWALELEKTIDRLERRLALKRPTPRRKPPPPTEPLES